MSEARATVEAVFREEHGLLLATLIGRCGDFERAEEALQDALTIALERWPADGTPARPAAWILGTAQHRLIDGLRRETRRPDKEAHLARPEVSPPSGLPDLDEADVFPADDDRLRLLFTCCHPALAREAQTALILNALGGLSTREIARAFLVSEATMAQRLVRGKRKIRQAGIPFRVPQADQLRERIDVVLQVVYLVFNEGYAASEGVALLRRGLCAEAIRLGRLLHELLPDELEVAGLLALMLLQDARRDARMDADGELIRLRDQDRSRWDAAAVDEGRTLLERALQGGRAGPYQVQAALAAVHADAQDAASTDWPQAVRLYDVLLTMEPTPVVALNRAVAVAMAQGPEAGLEALVPIEQDGALDGYLYLHATRADLLREAGRLPESREAYARAIALATNEAEQRFLAARLAEITRTRPA